MKNDTIKKINSFGKAGYIVSKIGEVVLAIAVVACLVGAVIMCFVPKEAVEVELSSTNSAVVKINERVDLSKILEFDESDGAIEIGNNTYKLVTGNEDGPETVKTTLYLSQIKWLLFGGVIICASAYVVFYFARRLCAYFMNCETPFTEEISKCITNLAWSLIPVSVVSSVLESTVDSIGTGNFDIVIGVDLTTVLLVLCVFMLAFIFKYGAELQTESDETL